MKKTALLLILSALTCAAQQPPKKPAAPAPKSLPVVTSYVPDEPALIAFLQAQVAQKNAQIAVLSDPKYVAMVNTNNDFAAKANAACPAKGDQKYQIDPSTLLCEPVK